MKKFLIFVAAVVFFLKLGSFPVLAACDPAVYGPGTNKVATVIDILGASCGYPSCGLGECTEHSSRRAAGSIICTSTCHPLVGAAPGASNKQATCPDGYLSTKDAVVFGGAKVNVTCGGTLSDACCLAAKDLQSGYCAGHGDVHEAALTCNDILNNSSFKERDRCSPDSLYYYVYDKTAKVCKPADKSDVYLCLSGKCDTGLGEISPTVEGLVSFVLKLALILAGLSVVIIIILVGYRVLTSGGNAEKLQGAKELVTSLIGGVLLIIFSMVILQAVGIDILGIPIK